MARPRKNKERVPTIDDVEQSEGSSEVIITKFEYMGPDADDDRDFVRKLTSRGGDLDDFSISSDMLY